MIEVQAARPAVTHRSSPVRAALIILSACALIYALGAIVFGVVALVSQLAAGAIEPTLYWSRDYTGFTMLGNPGSTIKIAGSGGSTVADVTGAAPATVAIYAASAIAAMLTQAALGLLALRVITRLRNRVPFQRDAWREGATISTIVLALGVATQLLGWWSRVAIISNGNNLNQFSSAFVPEPLTLALGLTLALIAIAFRFGERLQSETDGLI